MTWRIALTVEAERMLRSITDRRIRSLIRDRIDALAEEPHQQGKPLTGPLAGFRSVRAAGQRYRIIYRIDEDRVLVLVVAMGLRRESSKADIYSLAQRLIRLGLVEPNDQA